MRALAPGSLRGKLLVMALSTTLVALLLASIAMLLVERRSFERDWVDDLSTQADLIGAVSAPALLFNDARTARRTLALLRLRPHIVSAALYARTGMRFASYVQQDADALRLPAESARPGVQVERGELEVVRDIIDNGELIGTVALRARYGLMAHLAGYSDLVGAVMLGALALAALLAWRLQAGIRAPLLALTTLAQAVTARRDFTLRAPGAAQHGEIGLLVTAFHAMLADIGRAAQAAQQTQAALREQVRVRQRAEQALRSAERRKDAFLANLAHELRNPLAPIRTGLDILRLRGGDALATRRATDIMERQLRQLVRLVDDLLDVARINSGTFAIRMARVELKAVVNDALEVVRPTIELHGHALAIDLPDGPVFLHGDPARLAQILSNLLDNAAKYTPRGGHVSLAARVEQGSLIVSVADDGIGMAPAMLAQVFEMFVQVDATLERSNAGLGVGLALARRLVELHQGTIEARSAGLGLGSALTVRLPIVVAAQLPSSAMPLSLISAETYRILLADDNVDFVNSIGALLSSMGHSVVITHNGADALTAAARFSPDFAFLDIGLPKLSGYDLARGIRRLPFGKMALLVAVTGWGQEKDRQLAFEAGFDHHLVKPVRFEQIEEILTSAAASRGRTPEPPRAG